MSATLKKSKKRSGTRAEQQLEGSTFYVDDCLGKSVAQTLRADAWKIEWHREHFHKDRVLDVEIYQYISKRGWIFLTCDKGIRRKPFEIDQLIECNIRAFSLSKSDTGVEMANAFIRNKLDIGRTLHKHNHPFVAYVQKNAVEIPQSVYDRIAASIARNSGGDVEDEKH